MQLSLFYEIWAAVGTSTHDLGPIVDPVFPYRDEFSEHEICLGERLFFHGATILVEVDGNPRRYRDRYLNSGLDFQTPNEVEVRH